MLHFHVQNKQKCRLYVKISIFVLRFQSSFVIVIIPLFFLLKLTIHLNLIIIDFRGIIVYYLYIFKPRLLI